MRVRPLASLLLPLAVLAACGGASGALRKATDDDFRAIQREEATLAEARATADQSEGCTEVCAAAARARGATDRLCAIAERVADADARSRCRRARDQDREIAAVADARCTCAEQ